MRWPFRVKRHDCAIRAFRDPESGKLTLRLQVDIGSALQQLRPERRSQRVDVYMRILAWLGICGELP